MKGKDLRGIKPIKLKNKHYKLYYDFDCLCDLEDEYKNITDLFQNLHKQTMKQTRLLLWAGLRRFHPELMLEDVSKLIEFNFAKINEIQFTIVEAILMATKMNDEEEQPTDDLPEEMKAFLKEANDEKLKN